MVKIVFFNLLRSKYNIKEELVKPGTIYSMIDEILIRYPKIQKKEFETAIVFHNNKPIHYRNFDRVIEDGETIIFTHFVGGG